MNKKIYRVKLSYYEHFLNKPLPVPCFRIEYGAFMFSWSIETAKQFMKHLMSIQPTKFYISSTTEIEVVSSKSEVFQKIIDTYNKIGNKKIDKFEIISIICFIVEPNVDIALTTSLSYFCLENENLELITKNEFGLFIDSFLRSLHNMLVFDETDELYAKTKSHIVKLSESDLDDILNKIFKNEEKELPISDVIRKIPEDFRKMIVNVSEGMNKTLTYYGNKIKQETMMN